MLGQALNNEVCTRGVMEYKMADNYMMKHGVNLLRRIDPDLLDVVGSDEDQAPPGVGQFSIFHSFWPIKREDPGISVGTATDIVIPVDSKNGDILEGKAFLVCFSFLNVEDLKCCRLVCRKWRSIANPILKQISCVTIHGEITGSFFKDGAVEKCIKYLKNSVSKFSLWTTLRLMNVKESQVKVLLASRDFQIAVKSILELQIIKCEISWNSLLKIMRQFINLQILYDKKTIYTDSESSVVMSSLALWNSGNKSDGPIETNFVKKDILLEDLKCLKIFKSNSSKNTTDLIKILTVTTVDVEEIHLKLDPQQKQVSVKDAFEFERHINIMFILNAQSLRKLYIDMMDTDHIEYFNEFLKCFRDWATPSSPPLALEELVLKFKYIWLSRSFENILLPLVAKCDHLKVLGLGLISFKPDSAHLLTTLSENVPSECAYEFGLCVSDHVSSSGRDSGGSTTNNHTESIECSLGSRTLGSTLLKAPLYQQHMTDLLVGIFHDDVKEVCDLIPKEMDGPGFRRTVDVCVFTNGPNRPNFTSFNIKQLTFFFYNVTNLEIIDGPYENYFEELFKTTSSAFIDDEDIQLIIKCMRRLRKLIIFANMETLTDTGITGLPHSVCYRMRTTRVYRLEPNEIQGHRFEHLKHLTYLSLRGIGTSLTDVSAYWGFSNVKSLRTLIVSHFKKLTPEAREYLDEMYPQSKGCFVAIL